MKTLLQRINDGEATLSVSLYGYGQEINHTECKTIAEAVTVLNTKTTRGHAYRLTPSQFAWDDRGNPVDPLREEVAEVQRACGIQATADLV